MDEDKEIKPNLKFYSDIFARYGLPTFSKGKPIWSVALYTRLSKEDMRHKENRNSLSIENQVKGHAIYLIDELDDFVVYDIYIDDGLTGTDFKRSAYQRMRDDVEKKLVNCIIVLDLTRYARNLADGIKELDNFVLENKIRFISIRIPSFDTLKDPTAISSAEVYDALSKAEDYARTTSIKVRHQKKNNAP